MLNSERAGGDLFQLATHKVVAGATRQISGVGPSPPTCIVFPHALDLTRLSRGGRPPLCTHTPEKNTCIKYPTNKKGTLLGSSWGWVFFFSAQCLVLMAALTGV